MNKSKILILSFLFVFSTASVLSYLNFSSYKPKVLKQLEEVKGYKSINEIDFPFPEDSKKLGVNRTRDVKQTTFQTSKTPAEVKEFYKNVFLEKEWMIESQTDYATLSAIQFKKEDKLISVFANKQENYSVVSIEITDR